jgi:hypothetical protein
MIAFTRGTPTLESPSLLIAEDIYTDIQKIFLRFISMNQSTKEIKNYVMMTIRKVYLR